MEFKELDDIDKKIINLLTENCRISNAEIGRIIDLTRSTVRERINYLVESGVIKKFTIMVNPRKAGKILSIFFDIHVDLKSLENVTEKLIERREITNVYQMSGNTKLHVHALVDSEEDLEKLIDYLTNMDGITSFKSEVIVKRCKERGSFLV